MSFVSFPTDPNIMNKEQLGQLKENYANMIVDGMDMDTLVQFAFDTIMENMELWDEEDVKDEICLCYDDEILESLMPVE